MADEGRILVVDDDDAKRYVVARMLRSAGYTVTEAATGHQTLERVTREHPEVIVLDVQLPDLDGMRVSQQLKSDPATRGIGVLHLSANFRDPVSRSQGLDAGGDAYLTHPVNQDELLATVRALLRIGRSERALVEANARLAQTEERLRLALDATHVGIWDWNPRDGNVIYSEEVKRLYALTMEGPVTAPTLTGLITPPDRTRMETAVASVLRGDSDVLSLEYQARRGDGELRWFEANGRVTRDGEGQATRLVGTIMDITERKTRETAMSRWTEFQQIMLGVVGHDLRNPLSAIITTAAAHLRKVQDEPQRRAFARISNSAHRATRIVNGLLDYTRARTGAGIPIERSEVNLPKLLRGLVEEAQANYPDRSVVLEADEGLTGHWDADRLDQVFMNLLLNALQYSPEGAPVRLKAVRDGEAAVVSVHNGGPVIPASTLDGIFQPFKRGMSDSHGLGLGLYIVHEIVSAHGGEVSVQSSEAAGTTFTVRLPHALAQAPLPR